MKCSERKCARCGDTRAVYLIYAADRAEQVVCIECAAPVDHTGLVECRCAQCGRLFATDLDHVTRFCSLACEGAAKAISDAIPF